MFLVYRTALIKAYYQKTATQCNAENTPIAKIISKEKQSLSGVALK